MLNQKHLKSLRRFIQSLAQRNKRKKIIKREKFLLKYFGTLFLWSFLLTYFQNSIQQLNTIMYVELPFDEIKVNPIKKE